MGALLLRLGQLLAVKWRTAVDVVRQNMIRLRLVPTMNGGHDASVYVTFIDATGISLYILRGFGLGGDMEAFIPNREIMWQSYFDPLSTINNQYAGSRHFVKVFPREFL